MARTRRTYTSDAQLINAGVSRQQMAAIILGSREYEKDQVTGYYNQYLHRNPDASGLAGWVNSLAHGTTDETVIVSVIGSTEYYNEHAFS